MGIKRLEVWIDGKKQIQRLNDQLARCFTLAPGTHRIAVVAVDKYRDKPPLEKWQCSSGQARRGLGPDNERDADAPSKR